MFAEQGSNRTEHPRENDVSVGVERHDGPEKPDCVGQWCCGCEVHPSGKPWGWNYMAWERHNVECH
jgi:hypothetical protein